MFARSLKLAFASTGSLTDAGQSNQKLRELDQSVQQAPDPRKSGTPAQPTSPDLDSLLDRYGVVS